VIDRAHKTLYVARQRQPTTPTTTKLAKTTIKTTTTTTPTTTTPTTTIIIIIAMDQSQTMPSTIRAVSRRRYSRALASNAPHFSIDSCEPNWWRSIACR
jgi:hypothetical protein